MLTRPCAARAPALSHRYIQHNNNDGEPCDMQTLGCTSTVWAAEGMQWGCIDGWNNYGGVSHRLDRSFASSGQAAATTYGCIHAYVRTSPPPTPPPSFASCSAVLETKPGATSGLYTILMEGSPESVYCDFSTQTGVSGWPKQGWALVYRACQHGSGGKGSNNDIVHSLPVRPSSGAPVASVPYAKAASTSPTLVRFASDFQEGAGYLFEWSTLTSTSRAGKNQMEQLLDGPTTGGTTSESIGHPLPGSTGVDCNMCRRARTPARSTLNTPCALTRHTRSHTTRAHTTCATRT